MDEKYKVANQKLVELVGSASAESLRTAFASMGPSDFGSDFKTESELDGFIKVLDWCQKQSDWDKAH